MLTWLFPVHVAEVDPRVAVGELELDLLAVDVPRVGAVGEDVGDVRVLVRRLLDPPVELQDEVAELLLADQVLVAGGLAPGVVVDHAVEDLPVAVVPLGDDPLRKVLAVEERTESLLGRRLPAERPGPREAAQSQEREASVDSSGFRDECRGRTLAGRRNRPR